MNLTVSQEHGRVPITVFRIEGRVNLSNAEALREAARAAVENGMHDLQMLAFRRESPERLRLG